MEKQALMGQVSNLLEELQDVDFNIPEDTGYFSIEDDLVRRVRGLARHAADLMRDVMEFYDAEAARPGEDDVGAAGEGEAFLKEIGAQISSHMAVQEVSGLAFVSRGQLLDLLTALDNSIRQKQIWKVASNADTALRRTGRALIAIESAMRECEGLPVEFRQWQDLDDSLEVRRIYSEFRRAILSYGGDPDAVPSAEDLPELLRKAANRIAILRNLDIYPFLRIDDRLQIRRLQKRIHAWLEDPSESNLEDGRRLWSDLVGFARLLSQVNHREELREHDRLTVDGLWRRFFGNGDASPPVELHAANLALLEPLLGREDELDEIILHPEEHSGAALRQPLERLRKELGQPFSSPSPHAEWIAQNG